MRGKTNVEVVINFLSKDCVWIFLHFRELKWHFLRQYLYSLIDTLSSPQKKKKIDTLFGISNQNVIPPHIKTIELLKKIMTFFLIKSNTNENFIDSQNSSPLF